MSDYISREKVLEALVTWGANHDAENTRELADSINALPGVPALTPDEAKNIAELVEVKFYQFVKELYEIDELDNLEWAGSILSGWRKLQKIGGVEEDG